MISKEEFVARLMRGVGELWGVTAEQLSAATVPWYQAYPGVPTHTGWAINFLDAPYFVPKDALENLLRLAFADVPKNPEAKYYLGIYNSVFGTERVLH